MFVDICGCYKLGVSSILKALEPSILCNAPPQPASPCCQREVSDQGAGTGRDNHPLTWGFKSSETAVNTVRHCFALSLKTRSRDEALTVL